MAVHPIDYRYGTEEMRSVWDEENKLEKMVEVEVALARAEEETGDIPEGAADDIREAANDVTLDRVKEIEAEIHHDVMAVVRAIEENCSDDYGEYIHFGATSNDIIDTADALRLEEACDLIEEKLLDLRDALVEKADEHKETVCAGRTHGQIGVPTTWGHKFAIWASETDRHLDRLDELRERLLVGQMSGAVGTQASFGDNAREISRRTMENLGLDEAEISNQIIQRDRHSEYVFFLANVATTLDKIGINIRNMQRTEIGEVEEGFGEKQVGSSTMPHKRNPIKSEQICGLARVVRESVNTELRNNTLWEERDLTNSSTERITFTETSVVADHLLARATDVIENLGFHDDEIRQNLGIFDGANMAEAVMMELARMGMGRQKAHERVRQAAMRVHDEEIDMEEAVLDDDEIAEYLDPDEVETLLNPDDYIGTAVERVEEVVERLS
ncbi:MAG: adenylosuccinate lyase [Halobacteria archaeon]|nr:adenylosuccinate lyase [Halobacteria archaeon]